MKLCDRVSHESPRVAAKPQPALAGSFGERLDAPVVLVAAAVEHGALDAGGLRALGEQRPARVACSIGFSARSSASVQLTAAIVRPASSSISWAKMPRLERNTEIRGRSAVPRTFARTRRRRLSRALRSVRTVMPASHLPGTYSPS